MSTPTLTWECESCGEKGSNLPPIQCPHCEADSSYLRLVLDEYSIGLILTSFNHLRERAEAIADALGYTGRYGCELNFEDTDSLDSNILVEWEERTCGCCPGDTHYDSFPVRMLLGTEEDVKAHAVKLQEEREAKEKREREAAAARAAKLQENRERAQLRELQAKYGIA